MYNLRKKSSIEKKKTLKEFLSRNSAFHSNQSWNWFKNFIYVHASGGFLAVFLAFGVYRSLGILLLEDMDAYDATTAETSFVLFCAEIGQCLSSEFIHMSVTGVSCYVTFWNALRRKMQMVCGLPQVFARLPQTALMDVVEWKKFSWEYSERKELLIKSIFIPYYICWL